MKQIGKYIEDVLKERMSVHTDSLAHLDCRSEHSSSAHCFHHMYKLRLEFDECVHGIMILIIKQGFIEGYSQRLIEGNIFRPKPHMLRLFRLGLSSLGSHRLRLCRLKLHRLSWSKLGRGGGGGGGQ